MRESQLTQIAKLAYHIAQQTLPTYSHPKSRHDYTFPQRVACVMLKIYLNYTYRDLEEWLLFAVGTASQLIVGRGSGLDAQWLAPLQAKARRSVGRKGRSGRLWLLADAGFGGRDVEWTDVVLARGSVAGVVARDACGDCGACQSEWLVWSALEGGDGDFCNQAQVWGWCA
jgi:hypothetical protein